MASPLTEIRSALLSQLQAVTYPGIAAGNVVAAKLPRVGEQLQPQAPCLILAAGEEREGRDHADTEGGAWRVAPFEVAAVKGTAGDFASDPELEGWRDQAFSACDGQAAEAAVMAAVTSAKAWRVEVSPGQLYDRAALNQQYAYSSFVVRVFFYAAR